MRAVLFASFRFLIIINVEAIIWALKIFKEFIVVNVFCRVKVGEKSDLPFRS